MWPKKKSPSEWLLKFTQVSLTWAFGGLPTSDALLYSVPFCLRAHTKWPAAMKGPGRILRVSHSWTAETQTTSCLGNFFKSARRQILQTFHEYEKHTPITFKAKSPRLWKRQGKHMYVHVNVRTRPHTRTLMSWNKLCLLKRSFDYRRTKAVLSEIRVKGGFLQTDK